MTEENCSCACDSALPMLVFPCAGGSNVGQISNTAALALDQTGQARLYCLAGVAAHIDGMVASAQSTRVIAIDGCNVACARKALEHAGVQVERAIIVTDLGIAKNHIFTWSQAEVDRTVTAALA